MSYGVQASVGVSLFFFALAWLTGLLRCYVRIFIVRKFKLDDWLALLALVSIVL